MKTDQHKIKRNKKNRQTKASDEKKSQQNRQGKKYFGKKMNQNPCCVLVQPLSCYIHFEFDFMHYTPIHAVRYIHKLVFFFITFNVCVSFGLNVCTFFVFDSFVPLLIFAFHLKYNISSIYKAKLMCDDENVCINTINVML